MPVSSLGIITDNPQSADAMMAAQKDLVVDCTSANNAYGSALKRVAQDMIMFRDGLTEPTDEMKTLEVRWRNPAMPSVIDSGDAMVKLISAFPWLADTVVALEQVGFNDEQITRLLSEKRRNEARNSVTDLLGTLDGGSGDDNQTGPRPAGQDPAGGGEPGHQGNEEPAGGIETHEPPVAEGHPA